jgi:hypothetical protein
MNDHFNKAFADIFGSTQLDPVPKNPGNASRTRMYPGATGARTPVTLKSGHDSLTSACRQHKGQP